MKQRPIPFLLMRGGTSRGPFFNRTDLPQQIDDLAPVLLALIGSGHRYNIDGIGGGIAVTTKVAMLAPSDRPEADIDYFFAQVSVEDRKVDFKPTCGNMLAAVGPAAIEMGMMKATPGETRVRIHAVNTGALVEARVPTPEGRVEYAGAQSIAGVPGTAAAIRLLFRNVAGSATGRLLPTGATRDEVCGISVTCLDLAIPIVIARAESFGLTGAESAEELDGDKAFGDLSERVRVAAGALMGMGDVSASVIPKFGLVAPPRWGGTASVRYFMPHRCHPSVAVTGAQCLAGALLLPGSVAEELGVTVAAPAELRLEHPSGVLDLSIEHRVQNGELTIESAGIVRTARLLARGDVFIPGEVAWPAA